MSLLHLFHWYDHTALAAVMRKSTWAFAVVEMIHLIGLALLGGAVLIVNLRLFGVILRERPADRIARDLLPLLVASMAVLTVTGILMVSEETMKCYHSTAFRLKLLLFVPALLLSLGTHRKLTRSGGPPDSGPRDETGGGPLSRALAGSWRRRTGDRISVASFKPC